MISVANRFFLVIYCIWCRHAKWKIIFFSTWPTTHTTYKISSVWYSWGILWLFKWWETSDPLDIPIPHLYMLGNHASLLFHSVQYHNILEVFIVFGTTISKESMWTLQRSTADWSRSKCQNKTMEEIWLDQISKADMLLISMYICL